MLLHLFTGLTIVIYALADQTTEINPSSNWGIWEGFGVSLAWWAKAFGNRSDLADIFFTNILTFFNGQRVPGLWFNIARYNAGACSSNTIGGQAMVVSPDMILSRQMSGYWLDWESSDPSSSSWDWAVDENQRNMLIMAHEREASILELFSNSPMWWMTYNNNPSGSDDGFSDNLESWNYDQHAVYLATIAQYAADNWGIEFTSVEAFNEPSSNWWNGLSGTQEGCHIGVDNQAAIIENLRTELDNRGLEDTLISASDENTYDQAVSTWDSLSDTSAASLINCINVHGYQYGEGQRYELYSAAVENGKQIWNSEYSENDSTGAQLASNLILDFRWLHPVAWVYWQAIDIDGWGLFTGDNDVGSLEGPNQKYFVLAQFARHIRPGMQILDGGSDYTVAAYDASTATLVIIAVNWGYPQYINFDLSQFSSGGVDGALVLRWSTQFGSGNQYMPSSDTYMSGTRFWSYFESEMIQTFEVSNVQL